MSIAHEAAISSIVRRAVLECFAATQQESLHPSNDPVQLFNSPYALALKNEIVRTGRKLWEREYVDGNGGNISARLSENYAVCTPTLCSKGDLHIEDLVLVDLENRLVCGNRTQTSEILLHLEIYKTVPRAMAVVHCHPPYATAHAVAGVIPQGNLLPEQEFFVGPLALTPYETPGTLAFAQTVVPVVKQHNTILLANHGIVCWADSITHAEWYVEIVETYCKTLMIALQLKSPLPEIPAEKLAVLLSAKQKMGLPDARLPIQDDRVLEDVRQLCGDLLQNSSSATEENLSLPSAHDIDALVSCITSQILNKIEPRA